jgi:hypothetical protein
LAPPFRAGLLEELQEWFPEAALASLASAADDAPLAFADRAVHGVLPLGLEASSKDAAADAVRALPALLDVESARQLMFGLEKVARAHAAPELLIRAAHGACACALSLALAEGRGPDAVAQARRQLVSALVRLCTSSVKAGVPVQVVVASLAGVGG